jgi:hypothetical protein
VATTGLKVTPKITPDTEKESPVKEKEPEPEELLNEVKIDDTPEKEKEDSNLMDEVEIKIVDEKED